MTKRTVQNQTQDTDSKTRPKIGIVLGSGGIKTISCIPFFEFIEKANIEVDLLVSCSGGSIFGAWWASCNNAAYMRDNVHDVWTRDAFSKINYRTLLSIAGLPFGHFDKTQGLIKTNGVCDILYRFFGDQRVEDLSIPVILQTTDLLNGDPVQLKSGFVRDAVYASAALFPIFPSICIEDQWLIDGCYSSPLPVMEAVMEGMDVIIVLSSEEVTSKESKGFVHNFMRCLQYTTNWLQRNQTTVSVDLHHHEIIFINVVFDRFIGLRAVRRIPEILHAGEKAVEEKKAEIFKAIENFSGS